jgi:hypothetical protein
MALSRGYLLCLFLRGRGWDCYLSIHRGLLCGLILRTCRVLSSSAGLRDGGGLMMRLSLSTERLCKHRSLDRGAEVADDEAERFLQRPAACFVVWHW